MHVGITKALANGNTNRVTQTTPRYVKRLTDRTQKVFRRKVFDAVSTSFHITYLMLNFSSNWVALRTLVRASLILVPADAYYMLSLLASTTVRDLGI